MCFIGGELDWGMAKRVSKHHYVATPSPGTPPPSHHTLMSASSYSRHNPGYSTDGELFLHGN